MNGEQRQNSDRRSAESPVPKTGRDGFHPQRDSAQHQALILHEFDSLPTIPSKDWWRTGLAWRAKSSLSYTLRIVCNQYIPNSVPHEGEWPPGKAHLSFAFVPIDKWLARRDFERQPIRNHGSRGPGFVRHSQVSLLSLEFLTFPTTYYHLPAVAIPQYVCDGGSHVPIMESPRALNRCTRRQQQQPEGMETLDEKAGPSNLAMEIDEPVSVHDREAFAAKQLPDLGHEVEDFQVYTWRLTKWRQLEKKLTSPEFDCGGHRWRILLFPAGNSNSPPNDTVSIYLDYANPKNAPEGWHACAQFALVMSNPSDPTNFVCSHAHHRFIAEECDWGFTRFHDLRKLFTGIDGRRPIIENDESEITVFVRVLKDPTGVLWHNFVNYDSKKETGYVGLKNQGATCYMNSLLQSLFCTRYFRKAVYQIPTEDDIPSESVALALQRVFYHLQTSDQPVGTTELTKSFGWKSLDSFMQHDVQEFNRVLQDKLESKMKGTPAEGAINKLFLGKMKSYIKCLNVDFESSRIEDFYDIQLNVKGMANLYESFKDYVAVETLEGDNKYQAEGLGLQDAKKGVIFQEFPPVLHLQLKRFEYDIQRDAMVKINDRHEFPFEIDLAEFLDETADKTQSWVYKLHGVLVHSGDLHGGHYFALIKPDRETRWLKYDDDRVTPVTDREVLEENYGGELTNGLVNNQRNPVRQLKRFTNAYMLVYIRDTAIDEVLAPFTEKDTPAHLKARLEEERQASEAKRREREEQHLYLTARVITDKTFSNHQGFDLATFDDKNAPQSHDLPSFRILKADTYAMFKSIVAKSLHYPESHIRLWVLVNRQNKTIRPDTHIPEDEATLREPVEAIRNTMAARQTDLRLYLDVITDANGQLLPEISSPNSIMIFLKYFDVSKQTLQGAGKVYVQKNSKVGDLIPIINERMRWQPTTPLKLYEEIKPGMIEVMKPKLTFAQSEIQDGDIVCFQVELNEKETSDLETQGLLSTPIQFYDLLQNRVLIKFKPRFEEAGHEEFDLVLSKKMNYDTLAAKVGEHLRHDAIKLRFTTSSNTGQPRQVLKRALNQTIAEILQPSYGTAPIPILFYEMLEVSIVELETKRNLKATVSFLLPKTSMVHDLCEQLSKHEQVKLTPGESSKIRVFEVTKDGKHQREFNANEMLGNLPETDIYAEEITTEELSAGENDKIISVFHFTKEPARTHGVPFKFVVKPGEKFVDTKKRLQKRMAVSDKDITKYKFSLIQSALFKQPAAIEENDIIYDHKFLPEDVLGLDHIDKTGKAGRSGPGEKAIVIKG
ncbi:Ubiquitin carboxyl-terminal hydrolase [Ceratobasidium theobromae]|uniref:ubiquitinyl hydrolase 1 n=1 Tax=Ceratobasidium theobromae TaxID=1582974 RepID=A0A5N5QYC0_9AGAM|nr:Ubiquitin carboxyl-terminal hydrolase [Ceratobasidium theobromae]